MIPSARRDKPKDRDLGRYWEEVFENWSRSFDPSAIRHSGLRKECSSSLTHHNADTVKWTDERGILREYLKPDIELPTLKQWHEVRHKQPMLFRKPVISEGYFSWENYCLQSAVRAWANTGWPCFYTIHNHALNGGREDRTHRPGDWISADVRWLMGTWVTKERATCHKGIGRSESVEEVYVWPGSLWVPTETILTSVDRKV